MKLLKNFKRTVSSIPGHRDIPENTWPSYSP
jgi:hypothetical protein